MIRQIVYTSRATRDISLDLPEILYCSRRNNPELELTGLLACGDGQFVQLIEGDPEFLAPLLDMLGTDTRHADFEIVVDRMSRARAFPDWSMAHADMKLADMHMSRIEALIARCRAGDDQAADADLIAAMEDLLPEEGYRRSA